MEYDDDAGILHVDPRRQKFARAWEIPREAIMAMAGESRAEAKARVLAAQMPAAAPPPANDGAQRAPDPDEDAIAEATPSENATTTEVRDASGNLRKHKVAARK